MLLRKVENVKDSMPARVAAPLENEIALEHPPTHPDSSTEKVDGTNGHTEAERAKGSTSESGGELLAAPQYVPPPPILPCMLFARPLDLHRTA